VCTVIKTPDNCNELEKENFCQLTIDGGQVGPRYVLENIERAKYLAFHYEKELVGIAAIKKPRVSYKEKVFRNVGKKGEDKDYEYEFGYAVTKNGYEGRGICSSLTQVLVKLVNNLNIFATTDLDQEKMEHILRKNGFNKYGRSYKGEHTGKLKNLFIRNPCY